MVAVSPIAPIDPPKAVGFFLLPAVILDVFMRQEYYKHMKKTLVIAMAGLFLAGVAQAQTYIAPAYPVYPPVQSYCPQLTYNLYRGLSDYRTQGQVSQLQLFLGYYFAAEPVPVTGYFGPVTAGYVARFQRAQGVWPITGGAGPLTRAAIVRTCGGTPYPYPVPATMQVTSPQHGQTYLRGDSVTITWAGQSQQQASTIIDLYSVQSGKIGTIAIQNGASGSYLWRVPQFPNPLYCTMQYPNGLCGINIPEGQYFIKATLVPGSGFGSAAQLASANSGTFTITSGAQQGTSLSASPTAGYAPLTSTFTVTAPAGMYKLEFGDGQSQQINIPAIMCITTPCNPPPQTVSHTYWVRGNYTAQLLSDEACFYSNPRCMVPVRQLGSVAITVY